MLFPHATPRPLKALEAYRYTVMGSHRLTRVRFLNAAGCLYVALDGTHVNMCEHELSVSLHPSGFYYNCTG